MSLGTTAEHESDELFASGNLVAVTLGEDHPAVVEDFVRVGYDRSQIDLDSFLQESLYVSEKGGVV